VVYAFLLLLFSSITLFIRVYYYYQDLVVFIEWQVINICSVELILTFLLDWIRLRFISVVILISSMVMFYSYIYLYGDLYISRFIVLVFLFVLSIILLVLSPNIVRILLGWDGLGLVSYCLVIYYQNVKSSSAGILTILSNRIGDVAILLRISWMFNYGGWNFYYLGFIFSDSRIKWILVFVVLAAITKRAQIPFSAWLPAAIAAPTPVSSLVHSSTLVTAGVYLLIRFNEVLGIRVLVLFVSVLTIFMSGMGANFEMDLKKIIALSTLSQLGVIIITLSLGFIELSFFHLITHALFKSLLFLCAGVYIHRFKDIQDIRYLGGVGKVLPLTRMLFIGCSLSLCGFPYLAGFYSKDIILETFFIDRINFLIFILVFLGTLATISYSLRLVYFIFIKNLGLRKLVGSSSETFYISLPILVLFIRSTFSGSLFNWIYLNPLVIILPLLIKILILTSGVCLTFLVTQIFIFEKLNLTLKYKILVFYLGSIWFLPNLSTKPLIKNLVFGLNIIKYVDHGWIEILGPQGIYLYLSNKYSQINLWGLVKIKSYLFIFIIFIIYLFIVNF